MNDEIVKYWEDYWRDMIRLVESHGGQWAIITDATGSNKRAVGSFVFSGVTFAGETYTLRPFGGEQ